MIGTIVAAALWALVASLVLSLVVGGLVAGSIALTRPSAAARGTLWSVALAAAGFAPVAILAVMLVRGAVTSPAMTAMPAASHLAISWNAPAVTHAMTAPGAPAPVAAERPIVIHIPGPPNVAPLVAGGIVALWALGALIGLAGLGRSIARVRGLKGRSSPLDGALATELPWLTTTPGREIYLRLSYETETPIAVGFRRPVILLPTEMATADGLTSIEPLIMHEYAHLARYDDWSNLAQRAIERIFWFNPLVWILGRRIALEREVAADEAVVARTHDPKIYASTLWRMAQEMRMPEHVVVAPGAMLTRKQISVRIERLLDEHPIGHRYAGAAGFAIALIALTGVAGLAATAPPIVLAQAAPTEEPAEISTPTANVAPLVMERIAPPLAPATPAAVRKPHVVKKIVVVASPVALSPETEKAITDSVETSIDTAGTAQQIQAQVQQKLGDVLSRHGLVAATDSNGPVTRDLIARCVGCDFSHRDLHGIDLSNISLVGDDFGNANLRDANFSRSKLQGVSFSHSDLSRASFHASKLTGVDLNHSMLDQADLSDASLTGVDLTEASMNGVNTSGIHLVGSSLP